MKKKFYVIPLFMLLAALCGCFTCSNLSTANNYIKAQEATVYISTYIDGQRIAGGSGFIINKAAGHIITAAHVLERATEVHVTFDNYGTIIATKFVVYEESDIAVICVNPLYCKAELHVTNVSPKLGTPVFAIGSPWGISFFNSLSFGHVTNHISREGVSYIQIDAAVNPGMSGGPVLTSGNVVVGVTSALISPDGIFCGIGLCVEGKIILERYNEFLADGG